VSASLWGAWVALFVSVLAYAALVLVRVALIRSSGIALTTRVAENGAGASKRPFLSSGAVFLGRELSAAALVGMAVSVVVLIEPLGGEDGGLRAWVLATSAGVALGASFLVFASATYGVSRLSGVILPLAWPVGRLLESVAALPVIVSLLPAAEVPGGNGNGHTEQADLEDNLGLLEAVGIKTHEEELRMIRGILRMDSVRVREVMRPRVDMVVSPIEAEPDTVVDLMAVGGYSKIPVHGETIDDIIGVVYSRDLLKAQNDGDTDADLLKRLIRPAIFVPESQNLEHLLRAFRQQRTQLAIVVDEYGGVSGLVTVNDLFQEIVGELMDEFDVDEPELQRIREGEYVIDGTFSVDDLNLALGTAIAAEGFDTVAGLVFRELGKMPEPGDQVRVDDLQITVQSVDGRRIRRVRVLRNERVV